MDNFSQGNGRKKIVIILSVAVVAAVLVIVLLRQRDINKVFTKYSVQNKIKMDSQITSNYLPFAKGVLRYSVDGISYYAGGKEVWNKAITMSNPIINTCEDYIVMAERNSSQISLFDISGNQRNITASYPIIDVDVSRQGVVAASMDDGKTNYIELSDKNGKQLTSGQTVITSDGYPIDISLSNDGTKLAVSYLAVTSGSTQSNVVFYNFSAVGENYVDRIVGGFNQYKTTIVPEVNFINNDTAVAIGDNMISIYGIPRKPKILYEDKFDDKIESVFTSGKYVGVVFDSKDIEFGKVLKVYNQNGKKVFSKSIDFQYTNICFNGKNVVINNATECKIYSFSGKERFNKTFNQNIKKFIPITDSKYLLVSDNSIEEIKLK